MENAVPDRREREPERWHFSKGISLGTIFAVIVASVAFYSETQVMKEQIRALDLKMEAMNADRIHKETVLQMFENRDLQMTSMRTDIIELKEEIRETNALLREIVANSKNHDHGS